MAIVKYKNINYDIHRQGNLYDVEFECQVCGCEFSVRVDKCINRVFDLSGTVDSQCECPCCHTLAISETKGK